MRKRAFAARTHTGVKRLSSAIHTIALASCVSLSLPAANRAESSPRNIGDAIVVNAASYEPGISPGSLAIIYGRDLTSVGGVIVAGTDPLPTTLAGVNVFVNGVAAPIYSVAFAKGQDQISIQVPRATIVGRRAALVDVYDHHFPTAVIVTDCFAEDPGIFTFEGGYAAAIANEDGSLIGPLNPAIPGEILALFATGLGPVSVPVPNGRGAPLKPLAYTIDRVRVFLDGDECGVLFSGLAPGFVGLYQVDFIVPPRARFGKRDVLIRMPEGSSLPAILPIE